MPSLDTALLCMISTALEHDFFHEISFSMKFKQPGTDDRSIEALRLAMQIQETTSKLNMVLLG